MVVLPYQFFVDLSVLRNNLDMVLPLLGGSGFAVAREFYHSRVSCCRTVRTWVGVQIFFQDSTLLYPI